MGLLSLTLLSAETAALQCNAQIVRCPGEVGSFAILPEHAPMIASLTEGDVVYVTEEGTESKLHIKSGVLEVCNDNVSICFEK